jgi:peptidoglycan hydrolase FlgJ
MTRGPAAAGAAATLPAAAGAEAVHRAARAFEAQALGQLLRPMFETVDTARGAFGGGAGEAQWRPMLVDAIAGALARTGGLGIAPAVARTLLLAQERRATAAADAEGDGA